MKLIASLLILLFSSATFAGPKLYVFDCGSIAIGDVTMFDLKPEETPVREIFVPCYLIEHEKGSLIFDTGLPLTVAGKGQVKLEDGGAFLYERSIVDQLAAMGIQPSDITYAAFSHLHADHAGGANAFAGSNVLIEKA